MENILTILANKNLSKKEILLALDKDERQKFEAIYHNLALDLNLIERTIPEKPSSSNQKYRLTELGNSILLQVGTL